MGVKIIFVGGGQDGGGVQGSMEGMCWWRASAQDEAGLAPRGVPTA